MLGPVQGQAQLPLKSCAPDRRIGRGLPFSTTNGRPIMNDSISSTTTVWRGTSSSISPGASCPSDCANGRTSSDQWDAVLPRVLSSREWMERYGEQPAGAD